MKKTLMVVLAAIYMFSGICADAKGFDIYLSDSIPGDEYGSGEVVTFIVELEGEPLLAYGLSSKTSKSIKDLYTQASRVREAEILKNQASVFSAVKENVSDDVEIGYTYTTLFNGFSVDAPYGDMETIKNIDGVKSVYVSKERKFEPMVSTAVSLTHSAPDETSEYTGKGQVIAVLDNAFETSHDAFSGEPLEPFYDKDGVADILSAKELSIEKNTSALTSDDVYVNEKIPFRYDYGEGDNNVTVANQYHGTHVAGIASGNDGKENGFRGVAPDAQLLFMKVSDSRGYLKDASVMAALNDAVVLGADVINCSFGEIYTAINAAAPSVIECYDNAYKAGVFVSTAAGNSSRGFYESETKTANIDNSASGIPNGFQSVTGVASVDNNSNMRLSSYSGYGANETLDLKPEISAPGGGIRSSYVNNTYKTLSGTSMSAPHIAGIVAILNEHLDKTGCTLAGADKVDRIQNLLMSTARVSYMVENGASIPYSPRGQGAGVANTSAAIKTPVILYNENKRTKILLGDRLSNQIELNFIAENLTDTPVTYNSISVVALTDGYKTINGNNYISDACKLRILSSTFDESVTIDAKSTKEISGTIILDSSELEENLKVFDNGFFIEGFIHLENSTGDIPSLGIPFMGFYGNWTKANIFDSTMYDDGGSTLVYEKAAENIYVNGTFLFSNMGEGSVDLGCDPITGIYNKDLIAISPNGDGYGDNLSLYITPMRSIKNLRLSITDKEDKTVDGGGYSRVLSKYTPALINLTTERLKSLPEGDYTLTVNGQMDYETQASVPHSFKLPFYVDKTAPVIENAVIVGNSVVIDVSDNRGISAISVYNEENDDGAIITFGEIVNEKQVRLELTNSLALNPEKIEVSVMDNAYNFTDCVAEDIEGFANFMYDKNSFTAILGGMDKDAVSNGDIILAFYDADDKLICVHIDKNAIVSADNTISISGDCDIRDAAKCRVFIWNSIGNLKPNIANKSFNLIS